MTCGCGVNTSVYSAVSMDTHTCVSMQLTKSLKVHIKDYDNIIHKIYFNSLVKSSSDNRDTSLYQLCDNLMLYLEIPLIYVILLALKCICL